MSDMRRMWCRFKDAARSWWHNLRQMTHRMSVFCLTSLAAYAAGLVVYGRAVAKPYVEAIKAMTAEGLREGWEPLLSLTICGFLSVFALRLYLQAWALDELPSFRATVQRLGRVRRVTERTLRFAWVSGITLLPMMQGIHAGVGSGLASTHSYLFIVALAVFAWGRVMKGAVLGHAKSDRTDSEKNWLRLDMCVAFILGMVWVSTAGVVSTFVGPWRIVTVAGGFFVACSMSLYQVVVWGRKILERVLAEATAQTGC